VLARTTQNGTDTVVEAITKVQSIDLVADPATTSGLYEHAAGQSRANSSVVESCPQTWSELTLEQLRRHRPDLVCEVEVAFQPQLDDMRSQLDEMLAREQASQRREHILHLLQEHGLPLPTGEGGTEARIVSEPFIETLMSAADLKAVQRLIQERAELVRSASGWSDKGKRRDGRPRSRDQVTLGFSGTQSLRNGQDFAAAIRGNY
jgi:hypothetical protein